MDVRTYRARSMHEALRLVRNDLGPEAAVLHTREVGRGIWNWFSSGPGVEVTASVEVHVPSRFAETPPAAPTQGPSPEKAPSPAKVSTPVKAAGPASPAPTEPRVRAENRPSVASDAGSGSSEVASYRQRFRDSLRRERSGASSLVEQLAESKVVPASDLPESYFRLFAELLDADMSDQVARPLIDRLYNENGGGELTDRAAAKSRLAAMIQSEIKVTGPLAITPGHTRVVALVGPTGVGKTTTIAKLAANYRLREKCRVGLITVDTYRIAAVDQLRTYADIIDLPMEVVSTPRQMREAIGRMQELDLVLLDTAGRSPHDEVRIQELRAMLGEAQPHEVQLVLSTVASTRSLVQTSQKFGEIGATSLVLTKLDEASTLSGLLPLLRSSRLPVSYVTDGQNVPDDIRPANAASLAEAVFMSPQMS